MDAECRLLPAVCPMWSGVLMSPNELTRRLHEVIDTALSDSFTVEIDRAVGRAEIEACEAERREAETVRDEVTAALCKLADVLDLADDVTSYRSGHVGTHYEDCYRHHAGCLAARIRATADPRVEPRESATNPECNHNKTKEDE